MNKSARPNAKRVEGGDSNDGKCSDDTYSRFVIETIVVSSDQHSVDVPGQKKCHDGLTGSALHSDTAPGFQKSPYRT